MPLQVTPHLVTVQTVSQTVTTNSVLGNPARGSVSSPIRCLCVPMKPADSFKRYGVVLTDAWTLYVNPGDAASFPPYAEVTFNGQVMYVQGDYELHQTGDPTDCALVYMTRLMYPEVS